MAGCTTAGDTTIGGRPLIYKQGPGDPPSTIEEHAGIVAKRETPEELAAKIAARPPETRAMLTRRGAPAPEVPAAPAAAQPAPETLAQAAAPAAAPPVASNLFGRYTQAMRYGDLLFVSGQIATDPRSGKFDAQQGIRNQTRQALENVRAILEDNRLTMANVVSTTVYLGNISQLPDVDAVYHEFFKGTPPARTVVEVSHLPRGAQIEIAVVAGR